ncbi:MAG: hypothetical protein IJW16_01325 [Clostridia bacterium]|nr:hypothetical protein [Clostridia bacterium]
MKYKYGFKNRERVGRWFEIGILASGGGLILLDLFGPANGAAFLGFVIIFIWTFIHGQRNGLALQELERKYTKTLRQEGEMTIERAHVVRITLQASLPLYLGMAFPILLMPVGGFYALGAFFPLFAVVGIRFHFFYERWKGLELKPSFYWWMQVGICLAMIVISYLFFFLVMGGEVRH